MTGWQAHVAKWKDCTRCPLSTGRSKVVLARGKIPCDILFIGEAPGESEDVIGSPFVGPAGKLLDNIIEESIYMHAPSWRLGFTNLVACIPRGEDGTGKAEEPDAKCIKACSGRLAEFVNLAQPQLVVLVGSLARKHIPGQSTFGSNLTWLRNGQYLKFCEISHPAFILRANVAQQGLLIQRCQVALTNAVEELIPF